MTIDERYLQLVYRVPSTTSRARVAVWRELKRLGALYIQQAVCVLPDRPGVRERLDKVRERIDELGGESMIFVLTEVEEREHRALVESFRENSAKEYAEIVEECETKFFKEIEFERFRENYTFEEAEEIRQDLEKLRRWLRKVEARDWMGAPGRELAHEKVAECERLLDLFEADVYERVGDPGTV
ncbi:Chromate resistance protein ChrB [Microtetraspora fusca]|uniref:Chromate resistance protein ChrB n=1 Tax=Microtetraspora fusca TaxID=1997 RepID=A0ABW6VH60_MICFU|nr:Chromate resistance protein ChrB [Microtetraspora fusca]